MERTEGVALVGLKDGAARVLALEDLDAPKGTALARVGRGGDGVRHYPSVRRGGWQV